MSDLLQPKEVTLTSIDGNTKTYFISKIPAIPAREIITQYPVTAIPKIGDYKTNEALMLKLMNFVGVEIGEKVQRLSTKELINNHVEDFEVLMKLEGLMIDYNCSFFTKGTGLTFFALIEEKAKVWISKIVTVLQDQSLQKDAQPSTNSEQSIP